LKDARVQAEGDMMRNAKAELEWQRLDLQLDRELEATFSASDALKVTRTQPDAFENRGAAVNKKRSKPQQPAHYRGTSIRLPR
jgi:hypothetical protein